MQYDFSGLEISAADLATQESSLQPSFVMMDCGETASAAQSRRFSLFSLPIPDEMSPKNLVPVLIGMDHIGPRCWLILLGLCD